MRNKAIKRETKETCISAEINLDSNAECRIKFPIGFMEHMFTAFSRHGNFGLVIEAKGDLEVDAHHLIEDSGIVLGQCFAGALQDKSGIERLGFCLFPMDEALVQTAVDISGRSYLSYNTGGLLQGSIYSGSTVVDTDIIQDFWQAFAFNAGITLHIDVLKGRSAHHIIEALFKSVARSLRQASRINPEMKGAIPSTKGVL
ncbi:MAG: imidazoleglycerol-phosphate dehydratase HisB [Spirochaetaceae bacterium]|jgi:imidazoleglycerol-phosphate dehydratase|nr:imidazoleglycerol-phosphate dehydratase HisB [Spirochaetaceae bacterium]